jgi:glycosyltransferase involved in cell wall biosynthesis
MKVSVIIPTRNRIGPLQDAVRSVLAQQVPPSEIVVVDDASDEDVPGCLAPLFEREPVRLVYVRQPEPRGACAARNRGVQAAQGDILMFLDDDDTWEPEKIARQLEIFGAHADVGLVYTGRLLVADADRSRVIGLVTPKARGRLYPAILYGNLIGTTSSVALRRSLFEAAGGFDERFPAKQDYDLWIRCARLTRIEHDGGHHVRYTIAADPRRQISGRRDAHARAVRLLLEKYAEDIARQGAIGRRKILAAQYYTIAKAAQRDGYLYGLRWVLKSQLACPNWRSVLGLLPPAAVRWLRRQLAELHRKTEARA